MLGNVVTQKWNETRELKAHIYTTIQKFAVTIKNKTKLGKDALN